MAGRRRRPARPTAGQKTQNPLAITGQPQESFSFMLAMDSNDTIADGNAVVAGLAEISGLYTRLAALEMLLFPTAPPGGGLIGSVTAALGIGGSSSPSPTQQVPAAQLPTVLFVWGPGRIVPVKVTALSITEKLYDATLLNPIHVEAQITLRVLTQDELKYVDGPLGTLANDRVQLFAGPARGLGDRQSRQRRHLHHRHVARVSQTFWSVHVCIQQPLLFDLPPIR